MVKMSPKRIVRTVIIIAFIFIFSLMLHGCFFLRGNIYPNGECSSEPDESLPKIIVYGDSRTQANVHRGLVDLMQSYNPEAIIHTGDMVEDGYVQSQWDEFNSIAQPFLSAGIFYPSLGNHERNSPLYFENFKEIIDGSGWYSVDLQSVHFIIIDSNSDISPSSPQYQWLLNDLQSNTQPDNFSVAVFHHPVFNVGKHPPDQKGFMDSIVPLFEQYDVDIVFSGHDHNYQRYYYNSIYYIISGGGGAPLYSRTSTLPYLEAFIYAYHFCVIYVSRSRLYVKVINDNGKEIDCFEVTP
ncbi:MAG: hypothetical protein DRP54_07865 [Spirochaetes bacterium]|nr:MAG: hypothetical protein DRP54_07865 [Spirochaetota bacterium]